MHFVFLSSCVIKTVKPLILLAYSYDDTFTIRHKITFCVINLFRININNKLFLMFCNLYCFKYYICKSYGRKHR